MPDPSTSGRAGRQEAIFWGRRIVLAQATFLGRFVNRPGKTQLAGLSLHDRWADRNDPSTTGNCGGHVAPGIL